MPRINLPELEDQSWFPVPFRNMITDYLQFMYLRSGIFLPIIPLLKRALTETGADRVVDLCSGGGGPLPHLQQCLEGDGVRIDATLTDKFPNLVAFQRLRGMPGSRIGFVAESVDASNVPDELQGFRTLFTGLHHLSPDLVRRVLANAAKSGQGIGIFEVNERSPVAFIFGLLVPIFVLLATPFIRPRRLSRFVFTYLIPVVPLATMWDGFASNMRTYSLRELESLAAATATDPERYVWETGRIAARNGATITYLLGLPRPVEDAGAIEPERMVEPERMAEPERAEQKAA